MVVGREGGTAGVGFPRTKESRRFSRKPSLFSLGGCCGLQGGEGNYCLALSKSSLFYKKRSDVESLSDPVKMKGGPSARLAEGY